MTAAGVPGRPYTIAAQLDWAAAELDRLEAQLNFSNATVTELLVQLEKMAVERDSLKQQLAAERDSLRKQLAKIAHIAHNDGLDNLTEAEALGRICILSLAWRDRKEE